MCDLNVNKRLANCAPRDRKSKEWMEITDVFTWWDFKQLVEKVDLTSY